MVVVAMSRATFCHIYSNSCGDLMMMMVVVMVVVIVMVAVVVIVVVVVHLMVVVVVVHLMVIMMVMIRTRKCWWQTLMCSVSTLSITRCSLQVLAQASCQRLFEMC